MPAGFCYARLDSCGKPTVAEEPSIGILILDDDPGAQGALAHVLSAEGWRVEQLTDAREGLHALASRQWSLVVANVALTGLDGPVFITLKELSQASANAGEARRVRTLFLVPEGAAPVAQPALERMRLPFVLKPVHLHDFLERISDLLIEAGVIGRPIRQVFEGSAAQTRKKAAPKAGGAPRMFAAREDYYMTEEEFSEWERQEAAASKQRRPKPQPGSRLDD